MAIRTGRFYINTNDPEFAQFGSGSGLRVYRRTIEFSLPQSGGVAAQAAIGHIDIGHDSAPRLEVRTENVTSKSFDVIISTWLDTRVYGAAVVWIAHTLE
ncbi:H-type lectin domain-containing protein [Sorangium sp. So ce394]|uniref:H-type lectin domain-containing protein n=1 Tax=Sorangium sp. So ce394 TaxID=3133310 RepID=UPI003F5C2604